MHLERMSIMFGEPVKQVLQKGSANYRKSLEGFANPVQSSEETAVSSKQFALGCLSITAVVAALVGLLVTLGSKLMSTLMPKMMATMMPKMMAAMEEADVQPPCAKIILDHLEDQA
jgi:hypothetical protein